MAFFLINIPFSSLLLYIDIIAEVHNAIVVTYLAYYSGYNGYIGRGRERYLSPRNMFHQTSENMKYEIF